MPYGITQCYLPPDRGENPPLPPAEAGTRFSDPRRRDARLSWTMLHETYTFMLPKTFAKLQWGYPNGLRTFPVKPVFHKYVFQNGAVKKCQTTSSPLCTDVGRWTIDGGRCCFERRKKGTIQRPLSSRVWCMSCDFARRRKTTKVWCLFFASLVLNDEVCAHHFAVNALQ